MLKFKLPYAKILADKKQKNKYEKNCFIETKTVVLLMLEGKKLKKSVYGICPFATTQRILTGKWAIVVLYQLSTGTKRFNELQRLIPEITQPALTRQLRQLEKDQLVVRRVYAQIPPKVEYSLSEQGIKFQSVLNEIERFGQDYLTNIVTEKD